MIKVSVNSTAAPIVKIRRSDGVSVLIAPAPVVSVAVRSTGARGLQGIQGEPGLPGVAGGSYTFSQVVPSATWVIQHNLGFYPNATVVDSAGSEVVGDKVYDNLNQITITFSGAFAGQAYIS